LKGKSLLFLKKKKQKDFPNGTRARLQKFFGSFFKKEPLSSLGG
jgi:hypothetical protein